MEINPNVWSEFQAGFNGNDMMDLSVCVSYGMAAISLLLALFMFGFVIKTAFGIKCLRRQDRVSIVSGFFQGYSGYVLDKRCFVMYSLIVGGEKRYIARWHLRKTRSKFAEKMRNNRIDKDKG